MLKMSPWLLAGMMTAPVIMGLLSVLMPAFGWMPVLGQRDVSLQVWADLFEVPGIWQSMRISLVAGLITPLIALAVVFLFLASAENTRAGRFVRRLTAPVLAIPHAAAALGLALLIAPSGFLLRLISPELTGWQRPPDLLIINDAAGVAMMAGLVAKEIPFLLLMALAALPQLQAQRRVMVAQSMGYKPVSAWLWTVAPALYPLLRLPLFAVIVFASSTVDVALILGPSLPPPLSVRIIGWFNDPDLDYRLLASAAALLQLLVSLSAIGLWLLLEKLTASIAARVQTRGWRSMGDTALRITGHAGMLLAMLSLLAGIFMLMINAVAGRWRFPETLPDSWTTSHIMSVLPALPLPLLHTVLLAGGSTLLAMLLVVSTLEYESRAKVPPPRLGWALYVPLLIPQVAFLYGLTMLTEQLRWQPGLLLVGMAHSVFVLPYVFLALSEPYRRYDLRWQQLAATLGASPARVFWRIKLPMLSAAIATAFAVGMGVSAGLYLPTLLTGAGRISTITTEAVTLASGGSRNIAAVWALWQAALPMAGFALALTLPRLLWRDRQGLR